MSPSKYSLKVGCWLQSGSSLASIRSPSAGRRPFTGRNNLVRPPSIRSAASTSVHWLPEPVGISIVKLSPKCLPMVRSLSASSTFTGNQIGPRQLELPPNRLVRDSPGSYSIDSSRPATWVLIGWRQAAVRDRIPKGERNSSGSNTRSRIRRSRTGSTSDSKILRSPVPLPNSSGRTRSGLRRCNQRIRAVRSGHSSPTQAGTSVAARIGSRPTIERTRSGCEVPSGATRTS